MPSTKVDSTSTTPLVEKEVEKFPETDESNCEGKHCEEMKTEEIMKTTEESEKMKKEKLPETENKDEVNTPSGNEGKTDCDDEEKPAETKQNMAENSKRKSTESSSPTEDEESPPKKRKSS